MTLTELLTSLDDSWTIRISRKGATVLTVSQMGSPILSVRQVISESVLQDSKVDVAMYMLRKMIAEVKLRESPGEVVMG